jgi:hypothetical protein
MLSDEDKVEKLSRSSNTSEGMALTMLQEEEGFSTFHGKIM